MLVNNKPWTKKLEQELRTLAEMGLTARMIADRLANKRKGITRNAILGKCHRLKIIKPQARTALSLERKCRKDPKGLTFDIPIPKEPLPNRGLCMFAIGDRWCNEKALDGKPYCSHHHAICCQGKVRLDVDYLCSID